jgi:hypothetical protein
VTQVAAVAPTFAVGRVLGTSSAVLFRNLVSFGVLALVLNLLPVLVDWAGGGGFESATGLSDDGDHRTWMIKVLSWFASVVVSGLVTAALSYGVFHNLRGEPAGIADCLRNGFASILPVVVASVVFAILIGLATVLFVIPGILVWLAYLLYVPAIVVEKRGIIDSFNRSAFLTKGRRWAILGAWLVFGVVGLLCFALLMVVAGLVSQRIALPLLAYVWQALFTAFSAVMTAVSYYYLRVDKEGVAIDEIAAVFD